VNSSGIHEKAAERDALRASDVMSERFTAFRVTKASLSGRQARPEGQAPTLLALRREMRKAYDPGNFKTRTL
jgi:hypothetical protein